MAAGVVTVMEWVTEQWCHAFPTAEGPAPAFTVHVSPALVAEVIAEAEVVCAAEAAVTEVSV